MAGETHMPDRDGIVSRRRIIAGMGAVVLSAGLGLVATSPSSAREAEPGDDRGGHGKHGGNGNDDAHPDDDHRNRHRRRRGGRH